MVVMAGRFSISCFGHRDLPADIAYATDADVETTLLRAAAFLGYAADDVAIERVASIVAGSCIPCTDVVASAFGTRLLVATPALY
jgi:hypothetical protein